ncbi:hypothetical protein Droror1_Dr00015546 [Drosera rotundifolia]
MVISIEHCDGVLDQAGGVESVAPPGICDSLASVIVTARLGGAGAADASEATGGGAEASIATNGFVGGGGSVAGDVAGEPGEGVAEVQDEVDMDGWGSDEECGVVLELRSVLDDRQEERAVWCGRGGGGDEQGGDDEERDHFSGALADKVWD